MLKEIGPTRRTRGAALLAAALLCLALAAAPGAHASHSELIGEWHLDQGATGGSDFTSTTRTAPATT